MFELEYAGEGPEQEAFSELNNMIEVLGLDITDASNLSCDSKYQELCEHSGIKAESDILFSNNNPQIV